ncbi:cytochrome p450, partial [Trifolium pratense]
MWSLWKHRNLKLWQNITTTCAQIVEKAMQLLNAVQTNNNSMTALNSAYMAVAEHGNSVESYSSTTRLMASKWEKPAQMRYKCNIDASFSTQLNRIGIGMCIRDDQGRFVLAKTIRKSPIYNVDIDEAVGVLHAIRQIQELQLGNVDFVMDAKTVVDQFHNKGIVLTEVGDLLEECKRLFSLYLENSCIEFTKRQANEVAHALAMVSPSLASSNIFIDVPTCIPDLVMNEM